MRVLMMLVMRVGMAVLFLLVRVQMRMPFAQMQPDSDRHQHRGDDQLRGERFVVQSDSNRCPEEGCDGEIRSGSRTSKMTQRQHEQNEADTVAGKADRNGTPDGPGTWESRTKGH